MINTVDLTSYHSGYDQYCEEIERENRISNSDYKKLEEKISVYENFVEELEFLIVEDKEQSFEQKFRCVKALLEDLKGDLEDV